MLQIERPMNILGLSLEFCFAKVLELFCLGPGLLDASEKKVPWW